jgi:hypothetical protein
MRSGSGLRLGVSCPGTCPERASTVPRRPSEPVRSGPNLSQVRLFGLCSNPELAGSNPAGGAAKPCNAGRSRTTRPSQGRRTCPRHARRCPERALRCAESAGWPGQRPCRGRWSFTDADCAPRRSLRATAFVEAAGRVADDGRSCVHAKGEPSCPRRGSGGLVEAGSDQVAVGLAGDRSERVALEAVAQVCLVVALRVGDELFHDLCRGEAGAGAAGDAQGDRA